MRIGAVGLAGVVAAGCSGGVTGPGSGPGPADSSPTTGTPGSGGATDAGDTADEELLASVLEAVAATRALVGAVRRRHPDTSAALASLAAAHAAHGRALGGLPAVDRRPTAARGRAAALAQVATAEQRLVDRVGQAVVDARSGSLAAVLASVAASLTQHLAALAEVSPAGATS